MNALKKDPPEPIHPSGSDLATDVYYRFLRRHLDIFEFLYFFFQLCENTDQVRMRIIKELNEDIGKKDPMMSMFRKFWDYISETMCIRMADNFLCFLSESIQKCMLRNPNLLKSNETVRIEDILKFSKRADIVQFLVDRKINEISYLGVVDIANFLESRTGIKLIERDEELDLLTVAVELRNIYTHNRGIVNDRFVRKVGQATKLIKAEEGKRLHAHFDLVVILSNNLFDIAKRLDARIAKKFRIRRKRYELY